MTENPQTGGETYSSYLVTVGGVRKGEVDGYVRWAREFVRRGYGRAENRDDALHQFTVELRSLEPPWVLATAVSAARHYWYWRDRKAWLERSGKNEPQDQTAEHFPELVQQCREVLRLQHKSYRTEQSYLGWIRRFLRFCKGTPPEAL